MRNEIKRIFSFIQIIPLTPVSADLIAMRIVTALSELLKVKEYHLHTLDHFNKGKSVWSFQMPVLTKLIVKYYTILYPSICHFTFPREPHFACETSFSFCGNVKNNLVSISVLYYDTITVFNTEPKLYFSIWSDI